LARQTNALLLKTGSACRNRPVIEALAVG
jgi:hypothetical protein